MCLLSIYSTDSWLLQVSLYTSIFTILGYHLFYDYGRQASICLHDKILVVSFIFLFPQMCIFLVGSDLIIDIYLIEIH